MDEKEEEKKKKNRPTAGRELNKREKEKEREIRACNRSISRLRKGGPAESVS